MASVWDARDEQIAQEATEWLERLSDPTPAINDSFGEWVMRSPDHVRHFLEATAVLEELSRAVGYPALGGIAALAGSGRPELLPLRADDAPCSPHPSGELEMVVRAVSRLPAQCRRVVTLHRVYGWSQEEIADRLELSDAAVEEQLGQAILRIGRSLPTRQRRA